MCGALLSSQQPTFQTNTRIVIACSKHAFIIHFFVSSEHLKCGLSKSLLDRPVHCAASCRGPVDPERTLARPETRQGPPASRAPRREIPSESKGLLRVKETTLRYLGPSFPMGCLHFVGISPPDGRHQEPEHGGVLNVEISIRNILQSLLFIFSLVSLVLLLLLL